MAISRIETNSIAPSQTLTTPIIATTMGVGGATPAGSGSGITFPAAQSASTDANTLDDYEEGTWTPVVQGGASAGSYTYSGGYGRYTKVGNIVTLSCYLSNITTVSAGSGYFAVTGLPFAKLANTYAAGAVQTNSLNYGNASATNVTIEFTTYAGVGSALYLRGIGNSYGGVDVPVPTSGAPSVGFTISYQVS